MLSSSIGFLFPWTLPPTPWIHVTLFFTSFLDTNLRSCFFTKSLLLYRILRMGPWWAHLKLRWWCTYSITLLEVHRTNPLYPDVSGISIYIFRFRLLPILAVLICFSLFFFFKQDFDCPNNQISQDMVDVLPILNIIVYWSTGLGVLFY